MKKLIMLLYVLIATSCVAINAQYNPQGYKNSASILLQPIDLGLGIRYDRTICPLADVYLAVGRGTYWVHGADNWHRLVKYHWRVAGGVGAKLYEEFNPKYHIKSFITIGGSYNVVGDKLYNGAPWLNEKIYRIGGFETGARICINRFNALFTYDWLKIESTLGFGINF